MSRNLIVFRHNKLEIDVELGKEAKEINEKKNFADQMGGKEATDLQYKKGRLPVRERIDRILDKNLSMKLEKVLVFQSIDDGSLKKFTPGNFILGFGKINKRPVVIGGEDFSLKGGSPNAAGLRKSIYTEELALKYKSSFEFDCTKGLGDQSVGPIKKKVIDLLVMLYIRLLDLFRLLTLWEKCPLQRLRWVQSPGCLHLVS